MPRKGIRYRPVQDRIGDEALAGNRDQIEEILKRYSEK
jgi:hypothetical protein